MQYYPIFDIHTCDFVGIYKTTSTIICEKIQIPCLLTHSFKEMKRHADLMNETVDSLEEDRLCTLTDEDREFNKYYQSFYICIEQMDLGYELALIDLTPYSKKQIEDIKDFLSFRCKHFDNP